MLQKNEIRKKNKKVCEVRVLFHETIDILFIRHLLHSLFPYIYIHIYSHPLPEFPIVLYHSLYLFFYFFLASILKISIS